MLWPKINSHKEFDNEEKFLRFENSPPPPITFLVLPLSSLPADVLWGSVVTPSFQTNPPGRQRGGYKLSLFIFLSLYQHLGSKGAKFCVL